jgi:hypothetical protein
MNKSITQWPTSLWAAISMTGFACIVFGSEYGNLWYGYDSMLSPRCVLVWAAVAAAVHTWFTAWRSYRESRTCAKRTDPSEELPDSWPPPPTS